MSAKYKLFIGGEWVESRDVREVRSPFNGEVAARVDYASADQMKRAIEASSEAFAHFRKTSRFARSKLLEAMRDGIVRRQPELARAIMLEAGKPIALAEAETIRALTTFTMAAEEVKRFGGEVVPIDVDATGKAYSPAVSYWVPRGPIFGITPFNFPLNLVAHKVAPALASGNTIVIKPAPQAPGGAVLLAEIFAEAALLVGKSTGEEIPLAALQVLSCGNEVAALAVSDPRLPTLTFTGSGKVGWMLQSKAVGKKVALELGGNAGVIVHQDADLERAARRCVAGGFGYAGQSCISVQRILVQEKVSSAFEKLLVAETAKAVAGDPSKREVTVGPVIDSGAADRVMSWIEEAKKEGARVLAGGTREGNVIQPTILGGAKPSTKIVCEEAFGPVVLVDAYASIEEAISKINDSRYGLQAGIFSESEKVIRLAIDELEVGGVMVNEVPTYRADQMPYGGVKESGIGREGLRYAMEEYSEKKTVVHWRG